MFYHTGFSANVPVSAFFFLYVCPGRQKTPPKNIKGNWNGVNGIPPGESEVAQSCRTLCDPVDYAYQAPLSMGFSRQEYWSGLPFPSPGGLPDPGIEPRSPALGIPEWNTAW